MPAHLTNYSFDYSQSCLKTILSITYLQHTMLNSFLSRTQSVVLNCGAAVIEACPESKRVENSCITLTQLGSAGLLMTEDDLFRTVQ